MLRSRLFQASPSYPPIIPSLEVNLALKAQPTTQLHAGEPTTLPRSPCLDPIPCDLSTISSLRLLSSAASHLFCSLTHLGASGDLRPVPCHQPELGTIVKNFCIASYSAGGHRVIFLTYSMRSQRGSIRIAISKCSSADPPLPLTHSTAARAA